MFKFWAPLTDFTMYILCYRAVHFLCALHFSNCTVDIFAGLYCFILSFILSEIFKLTLPVGKLNSVWYSKSFLEKKKNGSDRVYLSLFLVLTKANISFKEKMLLIPPFSKVYPGAKGDFIVCAILVGM